MFDKNHLSMLSHTTSDELTYAVNKLKATNKLSNLTKVFLEVEKKYEINAVILLAIACLESNFGLSKLAVEKNNLFGLDARDSLKGQESYGKDFKTKEECIRHTGYRLGCQYLKRDSNASWRYCEGKQDIYSVGEKWCSQSDWGDKVINLATRIEKEIEEYRLIEEVDYKTLYFNLKSKLKVFIKELENEIN